RPVLGSSQAGAGRDAGRRIDGPVPVGGAMSVETERLGRVLVITICREHKRNAIDASIAAGLDAALNSLEDDPELWCGILTGGPEFFSAGADLAAGTGDPTPRGGMAGIIRRHRTKPLIAAVEG